MKRFALKLFLFVSVVFTVWMLFFAGTGADAAESMPTPPRFRKVLVLFPVDAAKEDRDAFLAGLEQVRLRHRKDYCEIVRKWRESTPAEPGARPAHDFERAFYHNPYFLDAVDVQMIRTDVANPFFDDAAGGTTSRLWDMESLRGRFGLDEGGRDEALIVVASDEIAAEVNRMIRNGFFESCRDETVILFAGVSSFDESVRKPQTENNVHEEAKAPYAFAIRHPVDPWPNMDLALAVFPKTKKVILLTSGTIWNAEKETACRLKLGPGKALKTILIPEIPKEDVTESEIEALRKEFAASVEAEIVPDTVIVSLSSIGHGQNPASWLPAKFDTCPIFADTMPVRASEVGGFCRSAEDLGVQTAELLERLGGDSLMRNDLPPVVMEGDELLLNEKALRRYGLKASGFPDAAVLVNTASASKRPIRTVYSRTFKICVLFCVLEGLVVLALLFLMIRMRAARRKRLFFEHICGSLPVRVMVMDRDGRILSHHKQYGEVEQKGEFPWKNIADVPWLHGVGALELVRDVFDTGKTLVRELVIDGERRVVVLSRTSSDVLPRPVVIAVSSDSPERGGQVLH